MSEQPQSTQQNTMPAIQRWFVRKHMPSVAILSGPYVPRSIDYLDPVMEAAVNEVVEEEVSYASWRRRLFDSISASFGIPRGKLTQPTKARALGNADIPCRRIDRLGEKRRRRRERSRREN